MKRSIKNWIQGFFIIITAGLFVLALGGCSAAYINPEHSDIFPFLGLALPIVLIANLVILLYWAIQFRWWVILPFVAIVCNISYIGAMYRIPFGQKARSDSALTVASYNVYGFRRGEYSAVMRDIATLFEKNDVDVACLQEVRLINRHSLDSMATIFSSLPNVVYHESDIAILSKYPVLTSGVIKFPNTGNNAVWADLWVDSTTVRILTVHMQTTGVAAVRSEFAGQPDDEGFSKEKRVILRLRDKLRDNARMRAAQAQELRQLIDTTTCPLIVCGDFNDTPSSYTYHTMRGKLTDGFKACGKGFGATFRSLRNVLRIDYIFYSPAFHGIRYDTPDVPFSDHRPVILHAEYDPQNID